MSKAFFKQGASFLFYDFARIQHHIDQSETILGYGMIKGGCLLKQSDRWF